MSSALYALRLGCAGCVRVRSREAHLSPIASREECDAVRGRFLPRIFGWMVHANVLEGDDPAAVWGMSHDGMSHDRGRED